MLSGKRVLITGGTGSFGRTFVRRLLGGEVGDPEKVIVFSRDEAKQHQMRLEWKHLGQATDEVIYHKRDEILEFCIGDVRDYPSVAAAVRRADVVINAAALKQVPTCEYFPVQAVSTNVIGASNIVRALTEQEHSVETVVAISTDKACKPVNVMGMSKALQERVLLAANLQVATRIMAVRYGNVIASRGSVVPLFREQIAKGGPVTITDARMTRFLLSLDRAVDTVLAAIGEGHRGETWIPIVPAARVMDIAAAMIGTAPVDIVYTGIRPGEKLHEILVSEEEIPRTVRRGDYFAIRSILPELANGRIRPDLDREYSSEEITLDRAGIQELLRSAGELDLLAASAV